MITLQKIDEAANNWNKTKDPQYKDLWYQAVKEFADGTYYPERWNVSSSTSNRTDDGWNIFSK